MFGIDILDVAIGLFFGYLVLSLAVTTANEMSAAWFRRRAWMLHKGIYSPLDEGAFTAGSIIANRAQSLTAFKVGSDRVMRGTD